METVSLRATRGAQLTKRLGALIGQGFLLLVTCCAAMTILFIFYFILKDALPFFKLRGIRELFSSTAWYPSAEPASFGCLAIFVGSGLVTLGAIFCAVPLGICAAVCLSDIVPFDVRQFVKPIIEILAAIPSVAYGFFALVVFAPLLQEKGGSLLATGALVVLLPLGVLAVVVTTDVATAKISSNRGRIRTVFMLVLGLLLALGLFAVFSFLNSLEISSGTNALNASIILGIMAIPTVVSVCDDSLAAVGRDLREGSYALGATRAETLIKVVIPAAKGGILAAVLLGIMRAIGETMVVWMASGNAAAIPEPWYNFLEPVRTLTATIAGDMGEADHVTGSARYHVLFAMALCLLTFSFLCNLCSEWAARRSKFVGS